MKKNKHAGTSFESYLAEEKQEPAPAPEPIVQIVIEKEYIRQACDHIPLIAQFSIVTAKLNSYERVFAELHREVAGYPASGHPRWLPNQIQVCHELLRDLNLRMEELSRKVQNNNWQEVTE